VRFQRPQMRATATVHEKFRKLIFLCDDWMTIVK